MPALLKEADALEGGDRLGRVGQQSWALSSGSSTPSRSPSARSIRLVRRTSRSDSVPDILVPA